MDLQSVHVQLRRWWLAGLLILLVWLTAAAPVSAAPESHPHDGGVYHTVQYGEYLGQIAHRYGVSVQAILNANPHIKNPNLIYYGTVIYIPRGNATVDPPPASSCRFHHYVKYGETLSGLGHWYGVSPFRIAEANNIYNLNFIYAGQYLCIP